MDKKLKILTDPVSNKIIQLIRVKGEMTVAEIIAENTGIPRATIYRRIEKMVEIGAIHVVSTNTVRGQVEKVYAIKDIFVHGSPSNEDNLKLTTMSLMSILGQYEAYFQSEDVDVNRDKLFMVNYCISLNDKDFSAMLGEMNKIVDKYQRKQGKEDARIRSLYLLSAPGGEKNE